MKIFVVSIFPEIYDSFLSTSLIAKAIDKGILDVQRVNPREWTTDKHKKIDDEIYGGGKGMLMMAKPLIDAVESVLSNIEGDFKILHLCPTDDILDQSRCQEFSKLENIILVCGRYEGIDERFNQYFKDRYPDRFEKLSIGRYILMGGEIAGMVMIESMCRLIPGVIKEEQSHQIESYNPNNSMQNIEYPQYTRPEDVYGYKVPDVLLSGNHKNIDQRRDKN